MRLLVSRIWSRIRRAARWVGLAASLLLAAMLVLTILAYREARIPGSGSRQTVVFYSRATDLSAGSRLGVEDLLARLDRLDYREGGVPLEVGRYRIVPRGAEIHLRAFPSAHHRSQAGRVRVRIDRGIVTEAEPIDSLAHEDLRLEPERIAGFEGNIGAFLNPIRLDEAPPLLIDAVLAVEDRRFFSHPGIDPVGSARSLWANLRAGRRAQGGSTLTQQLARSLFLSNRKTITRKLREAFLAIGLEIRYSKKEILEAYLNAVYWGSWESMEIRGAREACRYYLECELEEADPSGIALLVGLIRAPNAYSPYNSPERARRRRDDVVRILHQEGRLNAEEARDALLVPIPTRRPPERIADASYFLDAARDEILRRAPEGTLDREGVEIFTTLDPLDQAVAVRSLRDGVETLEKEHRRLRRGSGPLQAAAVVLDPQSGEVRALVGGRNYAQGPFNRAVDAQRQPGSIFKPFVYLAAFQQPRRRDGTYWTPAAIVVDEPVELPGVREPDWPRNYDGGFMGPMTVRTALEQSRNVPTAAIGHEVGIERVAGAARDLGVRSPLNELPALSLGASEVNLLEITGAYGGFATLGRARTPTLVLGILGPDGGEIALAPRRDPPGIGDREAYIMCSLLQGVIERGTGRSARRFGLSGDLAGKSGTTDEFKDAWFIGFTPRRVTGVWVGFDREDVTGLPGSRAALPIWASIMRGLIPEGGDGRFARPEGIVTVAIDPETGLLATGGCPSPIQECFIAGTEPQEECGAHGRNLFVRIKRLLGL